jgi:hypothetical protein
MTWSLPHPPTRLKLALLIATFALFGNGLQAFAWEGVCLETAARVNHQEGLPPHMLGSIAITESGRMDPDSKAKVAWPWTVTSGGDGQYFPTKAAAVAEVRRLQKAGVENIDVGCMQINLKYHPNAFASVEAGFDPETNVRYAARFLKDMRQSFGSWSDAVRHYHSADDTRSLAYAKRVAKNYYDLTGAKPGTTAEKPTRQVASAQPQPSPKGKPQSAQAAPSRPPVRVADAEEIARQRAEARAEADAFRQKKLAEYLAHKAALRDG